MRHPAFSGGVEREQLLAWYRSTRARSKSLFAIPRPDTYYERPISLRNPIVFYEGHLPAFAVNTLAKLALKKPGIDAGYEKLFERGIDPEDETAAKRGASPWPKREDVLAYGAAADALIEHCLRCERLTGLAAEAVFCTIEHELMHHETFIYILHNMSYDQKDMKHRLQPVSKPVEAGAPLTATIPAGPATLGTSGDHFGWDNEFPSLRVEVPAFTIDRHNVTNAQYLDFANATGAPPPHFWLRKDSQWYWRGMFELIPLPLDWPVYVTFDEAEAYARWRGARVPTEAEYHRVAFGTPSGEERRFPWGDELPDSTRGNFDFSHWDPVPVGSYPLGASAWGVHDLIGNGWEWTSTKFNGFPGFEPMPTYPVYSADFFDDKHYVLKGASPATARELIRRSFRNWFRPNYPYLYATFRCVS
ncbi:MAG TPA: SUMF1/EgtB/PvdO family nonheme iron enzyme [Thermoanaerobaculia bacterium]|nr:SUMF1/EgtB/PvdO family nonheme iron enzyme [Thermoanaerobaculia bacterium]